MQKFDARLKDDAQIINEATKFVKKSTIQLGNFGLRSNDEMVVETLSEPQNNCEVEEVKYGNVNLTSLGGISESEKVRNIALALFEMEELENFVIDPRKAPLKRKAADEYRTNLYKKAVKCVLGKSFSDSKYKVYTKLVNQIGLQATQKRSRGNKRSRSPEIENEQRSVTDKENEPPLLETTVPEGQSKITTRGKKRVGFSKKT